MYWTRASMATGALSQLYCPRSGAFNMVRIYKCHTRFSEKIAILYIFMTSPPGGKKSLFRNPVSSSETKKVQQSRMLIRHQLKEDKPNQPLPSERVRSKLRQSSFLASSDFARTKPRQVHLTFVHPPLGGVQLCAGLAYNSTLHPPQPLSYPDSY